MNQLNCRIEADEIVGIATHNLGTVPTCRDHYRRVDNIGGGRAPAEGTCEPRLFEVERLDDGSRGGDESGELNLKSSVPPHLRYHPSRNDDRRAVEGGDLAQREDPTVALLDCDQGAGIENY